MTRRCVGLPLSNGSTAMVHVEGMLTPELRAGLIEILDAAAAKYRAEHPEPAAPFHPRRREVRS